MNNKLYLLIISLLSYYLWLIYQELWENGKGKHKMHDRTQLKDGQMELEMKQGLDEPIV